MPDLLHKFSECQQREVDRLVNIVCTGKCDTIEQYKASCAEIRAHRQALENFRRILADFMEEDEVDNLLDSR